MVVGMSVEEVAKRDRLMLTPMALDTTRPGWRYTGKHKPCDRCKVQLILAPIPGTSTLQAYNYTDGEAHICTGQTGFHLPTNGRYPD